MKMGLPLILSFSRKGRRDLDINSGGEGLGMGGCEWKAHVGEKGLDEQGRNHYKCLRGFNCLG
jgi:hypothetical protein